MCVYVYDLEEHQFATRGEVFYINKYKFTLYIYIYIYKYIYILCVCKYIYYVYIQDLEDHQFVTRDEVAAVMEGMMGGGQKVAPCVAKVLLMCC